MITLADLRKNYTLGSLDAADVDHDPIRQFHTWFNQALDAKLPEPNAMTVATVDGEGRPAARILLVKGVDEHGFVFFTNYESRKGQELDANPHASLLFYWIELERQVRAFDPWPVAEGEVAGETLRVWSAQALDLDHHALPGSVLAASRDGIDIACAEGALRITAVQRAGGKRIGAVDYLNARPDLRPA